MQQLVLLFASTVLVKMCFFSPVLFWARWWLQLRQRGCHVNLSALSSQLGVQCVVFYLLTGVGSWTRSQVPPLRSVCHVTAVEFAGFYPKPDRKPHVVLLQNVCSIGSRINSVFLLALKRKTWILASLSRLSHLGIHGAGHRRLSRTLCVLQQPCGKR